MKGTLLGSLIESFLTSYRCYVMLRCCSCSVVVGFTSSLNAQKHRAAWNKNTVHSFTWFSKKLFY